MSGMIKLLAWLAMIFAVSYMNQSILFDLSRRDKINSGHG